MRTWPLAFLLLSGSAAVWAQAPAPDQQQPVFRAGVDLLTVDATVVDRDGRQITDLRPEEFVVEVDGQPRPVVSAEYVPLAVRTPLGHEPARAGPDAAARAESPFFSTNARQPTPGRLIVLLVDEGNIRSGQGRLLMRSAAKFIDGLAPDDRVAMAAIPRGRVVDFTTDHDRIREALLQTVGQASPFKGRFYMSLSEAIATVEQSDAVLRSQLITRECAPVLNNPAELFRCEIEVEQEAAEFVNQQRQQTYASLAAMRSVLRGLSALDGPKSVILISEGLVLEGFGGDVDEIAALAADVRASLDILLAEVPDVDASQRERPSTPREDRDRRTAGLEMLAGMSRGALHRIVSSADNAFLRIQRALAGYYLLGVESRVEDRDGRRHRIAVKVTRRGATVYSRRGFLASTSVAASSPEEAVGRALGAPLTTNELPIRLATWTYKEPGASKVRLMIVAEIEHTSGQPLEYTTGLLIVDRDNRAVLSNVQARTLETSDSSPGSAVFSATALVDPGTYLLRLAVANADGRIGSAQRKFDAWQMDTGALSVGDLVVAEAPEQGAGILPTIEPVVDNGRLLAMMEVYEPEIDLSRLAGTLEIVPGENEPALLSVPLRVAAGPSPEIGVLEGVADTAALPPGRYLARATVRQEGAPRGHLLRPFRIAPRAESERTSGPAASASSAAAPSPPAAVVDALTATGPEVDGVLGAPEAIAAVLAQAEAARPAARAAFAAARAGRIASAAVEALAAGDQVAAAFLRGLELFIAGRYDGALTQLQLALQQAPSFAPARLYLGAALAAAGRHREAAGLLQSVDPGIAGTASVARMAALSWLRAGNAESAIAALEQAGAAEDPSSVRTLAFAYVAARRYADALPLLARYLDAHRRDSDALLAGIYATFAAHSPAPRVESLSSDLERAENWARAYATAKGEHLPLVEAWVRYLKDAR